jgi:hypothetical protein
MGKLTMLQDYNPFHATSNHSNAAATISGPAMVTATEMIVQQSYSCFNYKMTFRP